MNSVDAMEREIRYQVENLSKLNLPKQTNLGDCMIVGSGDSHVAALIAQFASNHKVICCNPMDIVLNPEIAKKNHRIYIVSVSGNTKANILAAKVAKEQKVQTTAITANPESKLAKSCDEIIQFQYKTTGIPTSGTISFTSSMLICLSLVSEVNYLGNLEMIYRETRKEVENLIDEEEEKEEEDYNMLEDLSSYIFLGDGILFPVAIYGALKINEVIGSKSFAYPLEEFYHAPIFSIKRHDKIMILGNKECECDILTNSRKPLYDKLKELDFSSCYYTNCIRSSNSGNKLSLTDMLLKSILFVQLYVVKQAIERGVKDCYFLQNKDILKLSSFFIYDMS
jgi:glutamine---fructose-6-phosphate transaminase (isomerizing)